MPRRRATSAPCGSASSRRWATRCYDASDQIIALYEANRQQVQDGADPRRTSNIPTALMWCASAPCVRLQARDGAAHHA